MADIVVKRVGKYKSLSEQNKENEIAEEAPPSPKEKEESPPSPKQSISMTIDRKDEIEEQVPTTKAGKAKKKKALSVAQRSHLERIRNKSLASRRAKAQARKDENANEVKRFKEDKAKQKLVKEEALKLAKENDGIQRKAKETNLREAKARKRKEKNENLLEVLDQWYAKKQTAKKLRKQSAPKAPVQKSVPVQKTATQMKTRVPVQSQARQYQCKSRFSPFGNSF